ncbi:MAG: hypothetical protein PHF63_11680, partial [Herbinix sp.]|nr:hypothetical protein [Herbinix sp.]
VTKANSLTINSAITLADEVGATIHFDEVSQTSYFRYIDNKGKYPHPHIVWFIDARSIDAIMKLAKEYGLHGTGIWNIMIYFPQMWLLVNSQYEIETILT